MIEVCRGSSRDPGRSSSGTVATGYRIGGYAVDAPEGVRYEGSPFVLITHAHCDHICGLAQYNSGYGCSEFAAAAITKPMEEATLCTHLGFEPPRRPPERILREGDRLEGDGFSIEVLETPGHSKGSLCFYVPELKAAFTGDTVFGGGALPSCTLPTSEPGKLVESYEKLASYEIEKICPGHGEPFSSKHYVESLIPLVADFI